MWAELTPSLGAFPSAVLTARDGDGYPASVRTPMAPDAARQVVGVEVPAHLGLRPGPASLLLHSHDEQLWGLRIILVRGALERTGDGWAFRPTALASGAESGGLAAVRMLLSCRKSAAAYLRKRGLARPAVPWGRLNAVKAAAKERA